MNNINLDPEIVRQLLDGLNFLPSSTLSSQNNQTKVKKHHVYLLQSIVKPGKTYIGYTVDPRRRLRQHNGEIVGGAKRTSRNRPWRIICYIEGFPDNHTALKYEWCNNHPKMMGFPFRRSVKGRIQTMIDILTKKDQFTSTAIPTRNLNLQFHWLVPGYSIRNYPSMIYRNNINEINEV